MVKLPKPKAVDRQRRLFETDKLLLSKGETRWAVGEFFEQAVADVSGGVRLKTDSRCDICPDLQFTEDLFGETKGIGKNNAVIFYECRFEKDQRFIRETGNSLIYWLWKHDCPVLEAESYNDLRDGLAARTQRLIVIDHDLLERGTQLRAPRIVNSGYNANGQPTGYGKNGTGSGWTIRLSFFLDHCEQVADLPRVRVYDKHRITGGVEVFVSRPEFADMIHRPPPGQLQLDFGMT